MVTGSTGNISDADSAHIANIITNYQAQGDNWISQFSTIIGDLQPDAIEVMNEPDATPSGINFTQYRDFIVKASTAFRAVKPNMPLYVEGMPYWDLKDRGYGTWASDPMSNAGFSDVWYCPHVYYDSVTANRYNWSLAYQAGNLAQAKTYLYDYIENPVTNLGLKAYEDAGLPICWTETGINQPYANWQAFLTDLYAYIVAHNQGVMAFGLIYNDPWGMVADACLHDAERVWKLCERQHP